MKENRLFLLLLLAAAIPLFLGLNSVGLFEREETRYAEMAREMIQTGDWLVPRLEGFPNLEKPPLTVWLTAVSFQVFGINEFAARLPSLLGALVLLFFTCRIGSRLGGVRLGLVASTLLSTAPLFFSMARILSTDTLFAAFVFASVDFLLLSYRKQKSWNIRLGLGVFLAAAFLSKGPLALVLIGLCAASFSFVERSWRPIRTLFDPIVLGAFLCLALPWFVLIAKRYPSYLDYFFVKQHWERFFPPNIENKDIHAEPIWYFLPVLFSGFFPWILAIPFALRAIWKRSSNEYDLNTLKSLLLWASVVFVFFSLGSGKRIPYLLPIWPVLSIGVGAWWITRSEKNKGIAGVWAIPLPFLLVAAILAPTLLKEKNLAELSTQLSVGLIFFAGGMLLVAIFFWNGQFVRALTSAVLCIVTLYIAAALVTIPRLDSTLSFRVFAKKILNQTSAETLVVSYPHHFPGLSYYGLSNVLVLGSPHELDFGMELEKNLPSPLLSEKEFQSLWGTDQPLFLIGSKSQLFRKLNRLNSHSMPQTVAESSRWLLLSKKSQ